MALKMPMLQRTRVRLMDAEMPNWIGAEGTSRPVELSLLSDAVFILASNGRILAANLSAVHQYGYRSDELRQLNVGELVSPELRSAHLSYIATSLEHETRFESVHVDRDGVEFNVEVVLNPIDFAGECAVMASVTEIDPHTRRASHPGDQYSVLERILDTEPCTVYIFDLVERRNVYVNQYWLDNFGYTLKETQSRELNALDVFHPEDLSGVAAHHDAWLGTSEKEARSISYRLRDKSGNWHWMISREVPYKFNGDGKVCQIIGVAYDVSDRAEADALLRGQNRLLELITDGTPLADVLTALIAFIEAQSTGMLGSILLLDPDGVHVRHGAAPSLPAEFIAAVDGQPIGPMAGSCGTAAYRKEPVFVADVALDPLWSQYKHVALKHGLRASWSTPIFDAQQRVLGTFAMYYRRPGLPQPEHRKLIDTTTHIASLAIRHHVAEEALRARETQLSLVYDNVYDIVFVLGIEPNDQFRFLSVNKQFSAATGLPDKSIIGKLIDDVIPEPSRSLVRDKYREAIRTRKVVCWEETTSYPAGEKTGDVSIAPVFDDDGSCIQLIGTVHDITARKRDEAKIQRLNQLHATLSQCNQTIVHCGSEDELMREVCRIAVEFGGMKMAWIGFVDDDGLMINPVAAYGEGIDYLHGVTISTDANSPIGRGPAGTSVRENRPFWCADYQHDDATAFWREQSRTVGWRASASLPLRRKGEPIGTLCLYTDIVNPFDDSTQDLLIKIATDISFALDRFSIAAERKREQMQLRRLSQIVERSANVIVVTDLEGRIEYVNPAFVETTGYGIDEVLGKNPRLLQSGKTSDSVYLEMWSQLTRGDSWQGEFINKRKDGTEYIESVHISPMRQVGDKVTHYLSIKEDITERRNTEEQVKYLVNYDSLTGLPNRAQLSNHLNYALSLTKRSSGSLVLMFLDLDRFKDINDTLGHSVGDAVLIEVASRLCGAVREEDAVSRLGGDEFILMLPGTDAAGAAKVAEKILIVIAEPFRVDQHDLIVTASIGIALYPNDGGDLEALSKSADTAMYRAKHEGRDKYCFFTEEMHMRSVRNMALLNALRHALERDQFELHYQPQLANGHIVGAEALLRWDSSELGAVSPAEFIPIAEECGLIIPIGEWVLRTAMRQLKRWMDDGLAPLVIAVNLSVVQFRHPSLSDLVARVLNEVQLPAELLELELTEGVAMQQPESAIAVMDKLHERGVRLSLDDFGTGYSSLNYLKKFKVYKLKIDQSFVRDISTDPEDRAIVAAIVSMAKSLGLTTIAEGVETAEQLDFLRSQGCDEMQGYYFSRPLPVADFESFVSSYVPA